MRAFHCLDYWGKARPSTAEGPRWHPLAFHSLDVAAVGCALLEADPRLTSRLAAVSGLGADAVMRWTFLALALHDLGKFAPAFQAKNPEHFAAVFGVDGYVGPDQGHDLDGRLLWARRLVQREDLVAAFAILSGDRPRARRAAVAAWVESAICHHGKPRDVEPSHLRINNRFKPEHLTAVDDYVAAVVDLASAVGQPQAAPAGDQRVASWIVAGLAVLADWIGSNQTWFCYRAADSVSDLATYWRRHAVPQAAVAVRAAGVVSAPPPAAIRLSDLLPHPNASPSPLQKAMAEVPLGEGAQLFVIEDQTGAGKTEAALALAGRLIAAGRGDGLFVALPTMATANAMYARYIARDPPLYKQVFAPDADPSIVLAHSRRDLVLRGIALEGRAEEGDYDRDTPSASAACASWLSDDRRRAALADCGVGTIDQAVLAVMPSRFQSLRLVGLARKIVIVDEVHAHDAYMRELICGLLRFHAALGGSAILLSATLPANQRRRLVGAFADGAGLPQPIAVTAASDAYPLVTCFRRDAFEERPIDARTDLARETGIVFLGDKSEAERTIIATARSGRAACWIRNTVADAMEAFAAVRHDATATLFHARFAMGDRIEREREIMARFGKASTAEARRGQVLIATQVAEQSLDLDVIVSDLAPIDVLIQRAGRLWRHARPGRVGPPTLYVLGPAPTEDAGPNWYRTPFPRAARFYSNYAALWLTAATLQRRGALRLPAEARELIEYVYGPEAKDEVPAGLRDSWIRAEGKDYSDIGIAKQSSLLPLREGYPGATGAWQDDFGMPTRLGEKQTQLRLARWEDGVLRPWHDGDNWVAWRMSEVAVLSYRVAGEAKHDEPALVEAIARARASWPDRHDPSVLVAMVSNDRTSWSARAVNDRGGLVKLAYDKQVGLALSAGF